MDVISRSAFSWRRNFCTQKRRKLLNVADQQKFLEEIASKYLGIRKTEDWYNVKASDLEPHGGRSILKYYGESLSKALKTIYPTFNWEPWRFSMVPKNFWKNQNNQKEFLESIIKSLNIKEPKDWYSVDSSKIIELGGNGLLEQYKGSLYDALKANYESLDIRIDQFRDNPKAHWLLANNRRNLLEFIFKRLNMKDWKDWYSIRREDILQFYGGSNVIAFHNNSHIQAIVDLFPEHPWKFFLFENVQKGFWDTISNQRDFLDHLSVELKLEELKDWYRVDFQTLKESNKILNTLLSQYGGSPISMIATVYSEFSWKIWKFKQVPQSYFNTLENLQKALKDLELDLNIKQLEDWYSVRLPDLLKNDAGSLLDFFEGSLVTMLTTAFPEHEWKPWKFKILQKGYLDELPNRKKLMIDFFQQMSCKTPEDWYQLSISDIKSKRVSDLINTYYRGSVALAVCGIFPEFSLNPQKFRERTIHKNFLEEVGKSLNVNKLDDWYGIQRIFILQKKGGREVLRVYENSLSKAITTLFPEHKWQAWRFQEIPPGYFDSLENRRKYLEEIGEELGIKTTKDWYGVDERDIRGRNGTILLEKYSNSHPLAITNLFPEFPFDICLFKSEKVGYWKDLKIQRDFFNRLGKLLGVQELSDWYTIKKQDVINNGGTTILHYYGGSLLQALISIFPHYKWDLPSQWVPSKNSWKSQIRLFQILRESFDVVDILYNYNLMDSSTGKNYELDIFIPSLNLGFEYQGEQHFNQKEIFSNTQRIAQRDQEKKEVCQKHGITLIEVPYWWNGTRGSILATIKEKRPELLLNVDFENSIVPSFEILPVSSKVK